MKKKIDEHVEQSVKESENKCKVETQNIKVSVLFNNTFDLSKLIYQEQVRQEKEEYEREISRLRELLANLKCGSAEIMDLKNELEAKHSREMEELRTYFEKKCAELEKK